MKNIAINRGRELWIIAIIITFSLMAVIVFPKNIDDGMVFFVNIGDFKASFGLKQTIEYLIDVPVGWLGLKMRFILSFLFAFAALFFAFLLGKVHFEGNNPLRVSNLKYANRLEASRYYNIGGKCRFSVIADGKSLDLYALRGDLLSARNLNEASEKIFQKAPGRKARIDVLGEINTKKTEKGPSLNEGGDLIPSKALL